MVARIVFGPPLSDDASVADADLWVAAAHDSEKARAARATKIAGCREWRKMLQPHSSVERFIKSSPSLN